MMSTQAILQGSAVFAVMVFAVSGQSRERAGRTTKPAVAAGKAAKKEIDKIEIKIVCTRWGKPQTRPQKDGQAGKAGGPFYLVGHETHWLMGAQKVTGTKAMMKKLQLLISSDPAPRKPDPGKPGAAPLPAIVIDAGPNVSYGDVIRLWDLARMTGFVDVSVKGFGGRYFIPVSNDAPRPEHESLAFPMSTFALVFDEQYFPRSPRILIEQGGRLRTLPAGARTAKPHERDVDSLRKEIDRWGRDAIRTKSTELRAQIGKGPYFKASVFLQPDRWVRWSEVRKVMLACQSGKVKFWKFLVAVEEWDVEAQRLRRAAERKSKRK